MKKLFRHFSRYTAEYVILHAMWQETRGKRPVCSFRKELNPRRALEKAYKELQGRKITGLDLRMKQEDPLALHALSLLGFTMEAWLRLSVEDRVVEIFSSLFHDRTSGIITRGMSTWYDLDFDSMDAVDVAMTIEEEFGIEQIPDSVANGNISVGQYADSVSQLVSAATQSQ